MFKKELQIIYFIVAPFFLISQISDYHIHRDGVDVDYRFDTNSDKIDFDISFITTANKQTLKNIILNANDYKSWYYRVIESKAVKKSGELYVVFVIDLPWPLTNREQVSLLRVGSKSNADYIYFYTRPEDIPQDSENVRLTNSKGYWKIYDLKDGRTKVEHHAENVQTIGIPWLLIKSEFERGLFSTIFNLRRKAEN